MTDAIELGGRWIDLSDRVKKTSTVAASPATAAETVVATTGAFDNQLTFSLGVFLTAECAYTLGTSGASCRVRIRQGITAGAGTVIYDTGVMTGGHQSAATLVSDSAQGFDTAPAAGQQYCLTLTVGSASATSTVSAVSLVAIAV